MTEACLACRADDHGACTEWDEAADTCCCAGEYDIRKHLLQIRKEEYQLLNADGKKAKAALEPHKDAENVVTEKPGPQRGDSGYIHPDAWPSTRDIGSLKSAMSVGRKRADKMFPINVGDVCDWAWLQNAGGGVHPIIGCPGNQATDLHHGPDKNTLNNERGIDGVGVNTNVWKICSFCHNTWHGLNNPTYPEGYDRDEQQDRPWLPVGDIKPHDPVTLADRDEVYRIDKERKADGRKGRSARNPELGDRSVDDEFDDIVDGLE